MAVTDKFANVANLSITESAAGTITFEELKTGAGIFEKMAMIIHRIEYTLDSYVINYLIDTSDSIDVALVTSDQITTLTKDKAQVIDRIRLGVATKGTVGDMAFLVAPIIHEFNQLPGGGLIVPATNLYLAIIGTSLAAVAIARMTIYFTYRELKGEEFWELVEATRALS